MTILNGMWTMVSCGMTVLVGVMIPDLSATGYNMSSGMWTMVLCGITVLVDVIELGLSGGGWYRVHWYNMSMQYEPCLRGEQRDLLLCLLRVRHTARLVDLLAVGSLRTIRSFRRSRSLVTSTRIEVGAGLLFMVNAHSEAQNRLVNTTSGECLFSSSVVSLVTSTRPAYWWLNCVAYGNLFLARRHNVLPHSGPRVEVFSTPPALATFSIFSLMESDSGYSILKSAAAAFFSHAAATASPSATAPLPPSNKARLQTVRSYDYTMRRRIWVRLGTPVHYANEDVNMHGYATRWCRYMCMGPLRSRRSMCTGTLSGGGVVCVQVHYQYTFR